MKAAVIAVIVLIALATILLRWRGADVADTDGGTVTFKDLPPLVEALRRTGANDSFWVVLVPGTEQTDGCPANLQFSIEDGNVGMDWVLVAESNIQLKEKFLSVVADEDLELRDVERNGVSYIRATGEKDWATVAKNVLVRMFGSERTAKMPLIVTGFEWKKT